MSPDDFRTLGITLAVMAVCILSAVDLIGSYERDRTIVEHLERLESRQTIVLDIDLDTLGWGPTVDGSQGFLYWCNSPPHWANNPCGAQGDRRW